MTKPPTIHLPAELTAIEIVHDALEHLTTRGRTRVLSFVASWNRDEADAEANAEMERITQRIRNGEDPLGAPADDEPANERIKLLRPDAPDPHVTVHESAGWYESRGEVAEERARETAGVT